jgi:glyoxylase-like metal-dependent hydrolase (beta-lactamase superfamily II)
MTIARPETLMAGATRIELGPLPPAHTDGDIYAFLPAANVLMTSDVLTVGRYPVPDYSTGGWIGGLIDAATALLDIANDRTRLVPGIGPVQSKADLQAEKEMLTVVKDRVWTMIRQGKSLQEIAQEAPTREFDAQWGANDAFLRPHTWGWCATRTNLAACCKTIGTAPRSTLARRMNRRRTTGARRRKR